MIDSAPVNQGVAPPGAIGVSALMRSLRDLLEHRFPLLWIKGEISNYMLARSGHAYFVLKDAQAQVRCVMFRQRHQQVDWRPQDGDQVEVRATLGVYEARGDVQLTVESMRRAGAGQLFEQFQRLRDKLAAEGLFRQEDKRSLPAHPRCIGVVTSRDAAALQDILSTLARRNPAIPVMVQATPVQGRDAAPRIARALQLLGDSGRCDVIILARGGGSIEDLWAFNEEVVARAIRACAVPVVSGVGHETDFTIADFAADCRAPTPTAAAELVSPDREALLHRLESLTRRLQQCQSRGMERRMQRLDNLGSRLQHPGERLRRQGDRLATATARLGRCMDQSLAHRRHVLDALMRRQQDRRPRPLDRLHAIAAITHRLSMSWTSQQTLRMTRLQALTGSLDHLNPQRVLERGYSVVRDSHGSIILGADQLAPGDLLDLRFARGSARARVEDA
jgi:exodeoxyribonuclease VII large subunit